MRLRDLDKLARGLESDLTQDLRDLCNRLMDGAFENGAVLVDKNKGFTPEFDFLVGRLLSECLAGLVYHCENAALDYEERHP